MIHGVSYRHFWQGKRADLDTGQTLAAAYDNLGQTGKAESLYKELIALNERRLGADSSKTLNARNNMATLCLGVGRFIEALTIDRDLLQTYERTARGTTRFAIHTRRDVGRCLAGLGRWKDAAAVSRRAFDDGLKYLADSDSLRWIAETDLATSLGHLGQRQQARRMSDEAVAGLQKSLGPDHKTTREAIAARAVLAASYGR